MKSLLPIAAAFVLIAGATILQGKFSDRWSEAAAAQLTNQSNNYPDIPLKFGDWVGMDKEQNEKQLELAGSHASIERVYVNQVTGEQVMVFMILGKSRDVSVHTPDACYVGSGFTMGPDPHIYEMSSGDEPAEFYTSTFSKQVGSNVTNQRIFWAWSVDGHWESPRFPRSKWMANSAVNKIYLINEMHTMEIDPPEASPSIRFAKEFLPLASAAIFAKPEAVPTAE